MEKTISMKLSKSTKGTHVYNEVGDEPIIPTLYIKKSGLPDSPPKNINIRIEYED